ncbi:hypothetical protein PTKIN_Ptkin13bG0277700 [Pterospermum kingtungense]
MDALVKTGYIDLALSVYEDFRGDGLVEESITFMILIKGLCKVGRIEEMQEVLERMREKGYKEGRVQKGYELFRGMKKKGILIDRVTYGVLIEGFMKDGKVGSACDLLKDLIDSGSRGLEPEFATVNPMLVAFAEARRMDVFCKLLEQMKKLGFSVIDDHSKFFSFLVGKEEKVRILSRLCVCHNKIIEMSCIPSIDACYSLAKGLCKIGEIDAAMMLDRDCLGAKKVMELLNEMMQEGLPPDSIICSATIFGMCKYGTIEVARTVFANLRTRKLLTEANAIVYDEILIEHMEKKAVDLGLSGLKFFGLESKLKAKGSTLLSS